LPKYTQIQLENKVNKMTIQMHEQRLPDNHKSDLF